MVLVEVRVLCRDYSVLEIGRNLTERNEFVTLVIRLVVNPGLHVALEMHRGGRRVDPSHGHKDQRGKRPKERHADGKPSNNGSDGDCPTRGLLGCSLCQNERYGSG